MLFRQLFDSSSSTFTYLLADELSGDALLIDSVRNNVDQYIQLLEELNLNLNITMDTHIHADHITGSGSLHKKLGCKVLQGEPARAEGITGTFKDGDSIPFGRYGIQAIHTPGHTDDSYCFYLEKEPQGWLFTGDTLLIRSTGRTDFQNGSANAQFHSLFNKLLTLPETTQIFPGHDYNGFTMSTIKEEKRYNPRLNIRNADEYDQLMAQLNLPKPKLIDIAVPENLKLGINNSE